MAYLTATSTVLRRADAVAFGGVLFTEELDVPANARRVVLPVVDWENFDSPELITVTVVPGDTLNVGDPA